MTRLSKRLLALLAALVLAVTCAAFAHRAVVLSNEPVLPPPALTIEDVWPLFNFSLP